MWFGGFVLKRVSAVLIILMEKCILRFYWKLWFCGFGGKYDLIVLRENVLYDYGRKNSFVILIENCVLGVLVKMCYIVF